MKNKRSTIIISIICSLLALNIEKVTALTATAGINFSGGGGGRTVTDDYNGKTNEYQTKTFLVTLIDTNGQKVDGTNSVYYKDGTNKDFKLLSSGIDCKYKYSGTQYSCKEYETDLTGDGTTYYNAMNTTGTKFQDNIVERKKIYIIGENKYDFITTFLYQSGFLNWEEGYYDIDDSHWSEKRQEIREKDYYILIEPTYEFYLNGYTYFGTSAELAQKLLDTGRIPWNLMGSFTYNLGINLYTTQTTADNFVFKRMTKGYMNMINSGASDDTVRAEWRAIASPEYGNGMGIIKLSEHTITTQTRNIFINKDNCSIEGEERPNGIIEFKLEVNKEDFSDVATTDFELEKKTTSDGKISCYDNVKYDFSNLINSLNENKAKTQSYVDIKQGTVTIKRYCHITTNMPEYDNMKQFAKNFNDYNNLKIPLNTFGTTINLERTDNKIEEDETNIKRMAGQYRGIYIVENKITFGYKENNSKIYIKSNPTVKDTENIESYIDFSGVTYGYSTKLYNNATDGKTYNLDSKNLVFKMNVISSSGGKKCEFKTSVTGDAMEKVKFRTISLDNPFPARDATTRLPGTNWLGEDNYVNTYINHNRGVKGSEVYNKEPIYTITLTPSQMIKIREYNKKHSYGDIVLNCVGDNNTSCFSNFLRTTIDSANITGACSKVNSTNIKVDPNKIGEIPVDAMRDVMNDATYSTNPLTYDFSSNKAIDFNKDEIISYRDILIYDNADKTTSYYTCADKTFENSGYMKKGDR